MSIILIKLLSFGALVLGVGAYTFWKTHRREKVFAREKFKDAPYDFYSLDHGTQGQLSYAPAVSSEQLRKWSTRADRFAVCNEHLISVLPGLAGNIDGHLFFNELTRGQKIVYSLCLFNGEVNNGGVWQFLFNRTPYAIVVFEALNELGLSEITRDYQACIDQLVANGPAFAEARLAFNDVNLDWEAQWAAFTRGYDTFTAGKVIEAYFFSAEFRPVFENAITDFVFAHPDQFIKT